MPMRATPGGSVAASIHNRGKCRSHREQKGAAEADREVCAAERCRQTLKHYAPDRSGSISPRPCSQIIVSQQRRAQVPPTSQPATTSVGQCTPRWMRLNPTRPVRSVAKQRMKVLTASEDCVRQRSAPKVRYTTAESVAWPEGKLAVKTKRSGGMNAGLGRENATFS